MIVHPKPQFFISTQPDSGCSPLTVFFPKLAGVTYYQWFYNNNVGFGNTGDINNTFINEDANTKTYNIRLVAKDVYGCSDTPTTVIRVFPKPIAKFSANPLSVYIPNQATYMTNLSAGASTYSWSFGDGAEANDYQPSHTYTTPGEFPIILMVSNTKGCKDTFELEQKVVALDETTVVTPNAFTPNASGSPGTHYSQETDKNNDIYHPNIKGAERYQFSVYSRWGELLFETKNPDEGWDGYYRGQICTQDVYIWKVVATFVDGKIYNKTGDLLLLR
jgi:gliding motility-associated-like protein